MNCKDIQTGIRTNTVFERVRFPVFYLFSNYVLVISFGQDTNKKYPDI